MKKLLFAFSLVVVIAAGVYLFLDSAPQKTGLPNPAENVDTRLFLLDHGADTFDDQGINTVVFPPQIAAWRPGAVGLDWSLETGLIWNAYRQPDTGRIYLIHQVKSGEKSLKGAAYSYNQIQSPNQEWPLMLTIIDENDGTVIQQHTLGEIPGFNSNSGGLQIIGMVNNVLYLARARAQAQLVAIDLKTGVFIPESWQVCPSAYLTRAVLAPSAAAVYSLCTDYQTGIRTFVALASLDGDEPLVVELPDTQLDFGPGNGLFLTSAGLLYAIDSDAGILFEIDPEKAEIRRTIDYLPKPQESETGFLESVVSWFKDQIVRTASAKRFMAVWALSPDGRYLALDGGWLGEDDTRGRTVLVLDMRTFEIVHQVALTDLIRDMTFQGDDRLYVLAQRGDRVEDHVVHVIDLASGSLAQLPPPPGNRILTLLD